MSDQSLSDKSGWTRDTPWRQGHILPAAAVSELGLGGMADTCVVVISHDCDIANDDLTVEPNVEVIVGRIGVRREGNFEWAKAPRTLHMALPCCDGTPVIELSATRKVIVPKSTLARFEPDHSFCMPPKQLATLRQWLAVRYNRSAFPDAFDRFIRAEKLDEKFRTILGKHGDIITAIYFDVDKGRQRAADDSGLFTLSVVLAYESGDEPLENAEIADKAAESLVNEFANKFYDEKCSTWSRVHLLSCIAMSEADLPVSRAKLLQQWRLEHVSLRSDADPAFPFNPGS
ncbi:MULTISPECIES: hypothetical protein [unclassified Thiomonas]|uniref:hypothetical protein n=1 Tax=unclassified Thiomonas TaxID=2625466 RepID=UPI0004DB9B13|nr:MULTISPECIES: hypothetical protein [unclassified Thiomonas]CQR41350.1 conserved hypothetical protein [Thiomonas sp. CB3]CDW96471.1 conserved hypothetical protein [Thiomonas sp. CB2]VDY04318.1 conserved protein of unknown function [Thiomonas sp. Bio17B3]VDY06204.1 conserved protein of unknown function [Thiomonas sp. Bio17B3]VDY10499.1 conserved protein of unknown function [Thiomonas sp. Sup16B3]